MDTQEIFVQLNALKQCIAMYDARGWIVSEDLKNFVRGMTVSDYVSIHDKDAGRLFDGISKRTETETDTVPKVPIGTIGTIVPVFLAFISTDGKSGVKKILDGLLGKVFNKFRSAYKIEKISDLSSYHITVVFVSEVSKKDFEKLNNDYKFNIEFFNVKPMSLDILGYKYQPTFELIKSVATNDTSKYQKYGKICINDPVVKYFNAQPNDVFKIYRKGSTGASTTYRMVKSIKMNEIKTKTFVNEKGLDTEEHFIE